MTEIIESIDWTRVFRAVTYTLSVAAPISFVALLIL